MSLPAGGKVTVQLVCEKKFTSYGKNGDGKSTCPTDSTLPLAPFTLNHHMTDPPNSTILPRRRTSGPKEIAWLRASHSIQFGRDQSVAGRLYDIQREHTVRLGTAPGL